ncbi:hypothetical protein PEX2_067300 [Penicillium expansum]|uniref:MARVEL domain-containing protein n=1 Tax=Penicillium expansum TaxID=27334 RepID=A0A0A2K1C3_PENEN|nr:hypothetical protein PEX2_067300 [Penicillium expansum]KGO46239.1 hypothetical protein PEXP_098510 [Penicillium expansum]KGO58220.1 hypothetical protein PEX2_067300 [Penicillium expansum]
MSRTTEDTPLLLESTADELGSPNDEQHNPIVERHQQRCAKTIFILTWSSALLAVFMLVLNLIIIFISLTLFGYIRPWAPEGTLIALFLTLLAAGLISFLNLARLYLWNRPIWLWLNLILDLAIAVFSIGSGVSQLGLDGSGWDSDVPLWFIRTAQVLSWLAVVFALIHLALFLVRCFLSFSYRPWREYRKWTLPRWRFNIEFKVKVIRLSDNADVLPDVATYGTLIHAEVAAQRV